MGEGCGLTRYARRTDQNHAEIREGLRAAGWEVIDASGAGDGFPDLIVKVAPGMPHMLEVKDGKKPLSAQALTPAQEKWHSFAWQITSKVRSLEEALEALNWAKSRGMPHT